VHKPTVMDYDGLKMALLPWICSENEKESLEFIGNCKADILGGHLELTGFEMMRGLENKHGMNPDLFKRFEMVLSGHFHCRSQRGNITYLGSQLEFFWSDAHDNKYFHILDTDTRDLTPVRNPHTLFHRIYYDDSKHDYLDNDVSHLEGKFVKIVVENKENQFTFDRFVDRIQNIKIHELKIQETFSEFIGSNIEDESISLEDTSSLMNSYVDTVDTELDKDRIKTDMNNLMNEAQSLEIA